MSALPSPAHTVSLISAVGAFLAHFETDRDNFPPIATWERDRVFVLASLAGGAAVYVETAPWRISVANIDKPKPRKRRPRSATIIPFPGGRAKDPAA